METLLSAPEAAARIDASHRGILKWINEGRLKATRVGRHWVVLESDLEEFKGKVKVRKKKSANELMTRQ